MQFLHLLLINTKEMVNIYDFLYLIGIVVRGPAYGIPSIRVDGNDILAVLQVTKIARERAIKEKTPILIEAMTFRVGHHSTSDDWTSYRKKELVQTWTNNNNPTSRFEKFLGLKNWWTAKESKEYMEECREDVLKAMQRAEDTPKPPIKDMFTDVYKEMPKMLQDQWEELKDLMERRPQDYPIDKHSPIK